jgi:hypothetical protein
MRLFIILLFTVAVIGGGLYLIGTHNKKPVNKSVTQIIWVKYFTDIGQNTKDTEAFTIRVYKDTLMTINDSVAKKYYTKFVSDTEYYVPYDTIFRCDSCKIKARSIKVFSHIPKDWVIFDYNKRGAIMTPDTTVVLK